MKSRENIKIIYDEKQITVTPFDDNNISMVIFKEYLLDNLDLFVGPFEINMDINHEDKQIIATFKDKKFMMFLNDSLETKLILLTKRIFKSENLIGEN